MLVTLGLRTTLLRQIGLHGLNEILDLGVLGRKVFRIRPETIEQWVHVGLHNPMVIHVGNMDEGIVLINFSFIL